MDDGETFNHATYKNYTLIEFTYFDGSLLIKTPHSVYTSGQSFVIDEVNLFGVRRAPSKVVLRKADMAEPGKDILYKYNTDEEHIEVSQLNIHMINHASNDKPVLVVVFDDFKKTDL
jgi:hypothetical protein